MWTRTFLGALRGHRLFSSLLKFFCFLPMEKMEAAVCGVRIQFWTGRERGMTKILLVEDSKFLRMATERALLRAGYDVRTAEDGQQALALARMEKPNLILLDMLLPKLSGQEVLKTLKRDPATMKIPVVVFTGLSTKNAGKLHQDGAVAFLEKSALELEKGCGTFLGALAVIVRQLDMEVPSDAKTMAVASKAGV